MQSELGSIEDTTANRRLVFNLENNMADAQFASMSANERDDHST